MGWRKALFVGKFRGAREIRVMIAQTCRFHPG
jgi:hypothetical protein